MIICTVDDTGDVFKSATELANVIGCASSYITYCIKNKKDAPNHFYCMDYGITILNHNDNDKENSRRRSKEYYQAHKQEALEYGKKWRADNRAKVKEYKEKWRKENQEWYNAYYRKQRKKKKEENNE